MAPSTMVSKAFLSSTTILHWGKILPDYPSYRVWNRNALPSSDKPHLLLAIVSQWPEEIPQYESRSQYELLYPWVLVKYYSRYCMRKDRLISLLVTWVRQYLWHRACQPLLWGDHQMIWIPQEAKDDCLRDFLKKPRDRQSEPGSAWSTCWAVGLSSVSTIWKFRRLCFISSASFVTPLKELSPGVVGIVTISADAHSWSCQDREYWRALIVDVYDGRQY